MGHCFPAALPEMLLWHQEDKPCLMKSGPPYWPGRESSVLRFGLLDRKLLIPGIKTKDSMPVLISKVRGLAQSLETAALRLSAASAYLWP